ncbi:serine/threonine protein kinase, partial [Blastococcus sp. KM273128]|nr:serine/threonine protein kinase [Blastococcus sp. KM273128]
MRPPPRSAAVLAGLVAVLLGGATAWALLGPPGGGERPVPAPIEVPARQAPLEPAP